MNLKMKSGNESSFYIVSQSEPVYHPTHKKILSFKSLERGWHYGEGVPFENSRLDQAIALNQEAVRLGFLRTNAFPGIDSEVRVTIYHENHYLEFTIETDETITYVYEVDNKEVLYKEGLSFEETKNAMRDFRKKICPSFGLYPKNILTPIVNDSKVLHSGLQAATKDSPLSANRVFSNRETQSADILKHIIGKASMNLRFIGSSQVNYYRLTAT